MGRRFQVPIITTEVRQWVENGGEIPLRRHHCAHACRPPPSRSWRVSMIMSSSASSLAGGCAALPKAHHRCGAQGPTNRAKPRPSPHGMRATTKPVLRFTQALNHGPPSCLRCVLDRREPLSQRPVQQGLRQTLAVGPDRLQPRTCKLGPHPRFGRTCRSGPASGAKAPRNPAPMVDARHRSTRRMGSGAGRGGSPRPVSEPIVPVFETVSKLVKQGGGGQLAHLTAEHRPSSTVPAVW